MALCIIHYLLSLLVPRSTLSYKKLAQDVKKGSQILCADGSIVLVGGPRGKGTLGHISSLCSPPLIRHSPLPPLAGGAEH